MSISQLSRTRKKTPNLYVTDETRYAGPHSLQLTNAARYFRSLCRHHAYTRWDNAFSDIDVSGESRLDEFRGQPAVFIANHTSHLDTVLVHSALPEVITRDIFYGAAQDRWFAKMKKWKKEYNPLYQSFVLGTFPIRRGGGLKALEYASTIIERGLKVFLFPEGTRADGESIGEFKHGATLLALKHDVPVVPIYLHGLDSIRQRGAREITPGPVSLDVLSPRHFDPDHDVADATKLLWHDMIHARQARKNFGEVSSAKAA